MDPAALIALRAPQWASDPRITALIEYVSQGIGAGVLGNRYGEAVGLKVLHILATEANQNGNPGTGTNSGNSKGVVASDHEGDLSQTYHVPQNVSSLERDMSTTVFGREFMALVRGSIMSPMTSARGIPRSNQGGSYSRYC
jgi:hypothetical protein